MNAFLDIPHPTHFSPSAPHAGFTATRTARMTGTRLAAVSALFSIAFVFSLMTFSFHGKKRAAHKSRGPYA
jgi:hypothetical protein